MARFPKDEYTAKRTEIKQALKDLFAKFGLDAHDVRVGIDDHSLSFQGDCKLADRAILNQKETKDVN